MKNLAFLYGKQSLDLQLSSLGYYQIFFPGNLQAEGSEEEITQKCLENPVAAPRLPDLIQRQRPNKITVVLSDITRVTGIPVFLPILINLLNEQGIPPKNITYLVAAGIHPPCAGEQLETLFGISPSSSLSITEEKPPYRYRLSNGSLVIQHNARDAKELARAGNLRGGTPLKINKHAVESDFLILTGAITLHYLAGFGGGRKAILPGISSYENCMDLHRLSLYARRHGKNARAALGKLGRNPVHQRIQEAAELLKPAYLINTICDEEKRIIYAVSGHWDAAFRKGARFLRRNFCGETRTPFDAAMVSCDGFPKDINFIQSHKSFENAAGLVKENGALLLLAQCKEDMGNSTFLDWFRFGSEVEFVKALKASFEINGQTALATFLKCSRIRTYMVTSLSEGVLRKMNIQKVSGIDEFVSREKLADKSVALLPHGSNTWIRVTGKL